MVVGRGENDVTMADCEQEIQTLLLSTWDVTELRVDNTLNSKSIDIRTEDNDEAGLTN